MNGELHRMILSVKGRTSNDRYGQTKDEMRAHVHNRLINDDVRSDDTRIAIALELYEST